MNQATPCDWCKTCDHVRFLPSWSVEEQHLCLKCIERINAALIHNIKNLTHAKEEHSRQRGEVA